MDGGFDPKRPTWDVQVTAMPRVAPGATVPVLVDRLDERRVYPAEPWARSTVG